VTTDKAATDWTEMKSKIKSKWSKLADAEVESFKTNMDLITDKIQKAYGYTKDKAEQEYRDFKKASTPVTVTAMAEPMKKPN
jgi:uncharacterized protein YjbJ (UPF0337 family)